VIIVVVGPTNSGKTKFIKICTSYGIKRVVTNTTRQMRKGEKQGVDYYFRTLKNFKKKEKNGDFVETSEVYGTWFGTEYSELEDFCVVALDPKGLKKFKSEFGDDIFSIFLDVDEKTRIERARKRGDNLKNVSKRILEERETFLKIKSECDIILEKPRISEIHAFISKNKKHWR
jgi:guanylate kinase